MSGQNNEGRRLVAALTAAGWTVAGERAGAYVRMAWPTGSGHERGTSLVVPLDDTAPEYAGLLAAARAELLRIARRGEAARCALDLHAGEVPA